MKKYILIVLLISLCLVLAGCGGKTIKDDYGKEHKLVYSNYAVIKQYEGDLITGDTYLTYDINTKIMYQIILNGNRCGISEYYINKDK